MRGGQIVEMGSHQELLERGGYYSTLFKSKIINEKEENFVEGNENNLAATYDNDNSITIQ